MKAKHTSNPVDFSVPFDNSGTTFAADNVHDAIIESGVQGTILPRAGLSLTTNGTVNDGDWITYTELLASPRILFPLSVRLKEMTWVNANTNVRPYTFTFFKNGQLSANIVYTITPSAAEMVAGYGYFVWPSNVDFAAGDSLFVRANRTGSGSNISDLALVLWIGRIP